jgi:Uma2 family endonuclease
MRAHPFELASRGKSVHSLFMPANTLRRPFTVTEFDRMTQAGIFREDDRVELIGGQIFQMPPIGDSHAGTVDCLANYFKRVLGDRVIVSSQNPIVLDDLSKPQPDITLRKPRPDFYRKSTARPDDILLLVEVADTSVRYDEEEKLPRYASAGIVEVWIVNLVEARVVVFRQPGEGVYREVQPALPGQLLRASLLPEVAIPVSEVLGLE